MDEIRKYAEVTLVLLYKIKKEYEEGIPSEDIVKTCINLIPEIEKIKNENIVLN